MADLYLFPLLKVEPSLSEMEWRTMTPLSLFLEHLLISAFTPFLLILILSLFFSSLFLFFSYNPFFSDFFSLVSPQQTNSSKRKEKDARKEEGELVPTSNKATDSSNRR